ncbi:MAG: hypothetical protein OXI73_07450 [Rhodospirillales bacterium]|nr:hypothetical protein [Rhodospirillales bacterium]
MLKGVVGRYSDVENLRRARISADIGENVEWWRVAALATAIP